MSKRFLSVLLRESALAKIDLTTPLFTFIERLRY